MLHQPIPSQPPALPPVVLPAWAQSARALHLLALIAEERPARDRFLNTDLCGNDCTPGYRGKNAARLRSIFDKTRLAMMEWASEVHPTREGGDEAAYRRRSDAIRRYFKTCDADAVIGAVLAAAGMAVAA